MPDGGESAPVPGPGPLLASGRAADVFDLGDGRVLRRYRSPNPLTTYETQVMGVVADAGVRVPRVFPLDPAHHPDRDIVMERIDGITMLDDLGQRPWKLFAHARLLARLHHQITAVEAPAWMMPDGWTRDDAHPPAVLHLDLHPMNVMLTADGPVVIDWTNASGGPAAFDAALTYVEMATFEVMSPKDRIGVQLMLRTFRRACGAARLDAYLVAACEHRLADAGITPGERINVAALRRKALNTGSEARAHRPHTPGDR